MNTATLLVLLVSRTGFRVCFEFRFPIEIAVLFTVLLLATELCSLSVLVTTYVVRLFARRAVG